MIILSAAHCFFGSVDICVDRFNADCVDRRSVECSLVYTMFPRLNDEQIEAFGLKVACGDHVSVDIVDITL